MYGFELDASVRMPLLMQRFMLTALLLNSLLLNPLALYFLLASRNIKQMSIRFAHVFLRINHIAQDIFFCYLYQPYPIFPLPAVACMGSLCDWQAVGMQLLTILYAFHSVSLSILIFLLFSVQQAMQPRHSRWRLTTRHLSTFLGLIAVVLMVTTSVLSASSESPPRSNSVIIEHNITCLVAYARSVAVYGSEPGKSGRQRIGVLVVVMCHSAIFCIILILVNSIRNRIREQQQTFDASNEMLQRTKRFVLFKLVVSSALYLLPGALYCAFALFPLDCLPDCLLFLSRVVFIMFISTQSTISSLVMIFRSLHAKSHHRDMGQQSQPLVRSSRGAQEEGHSL